MAWFVHLTPEKNSARVRRSGLSPVSRSRSDDSRHDPAPHRLALRSDPVKDVRETAGADEDDMP